MLTVTTPATDRTLLSIAELRRAVGITDMDSDGDLQVIGDQVSGVITRYCKVATAGATPVTLRQETLVETFRDDREPPALMGALPGYTILRAHRRKHLVLARRPIVSITSISECGTTLASSDYEFEASTGIVSRLCDDAISHWASGKIVVTYVAGWAAVPDDLKAAASKLVRLYWSNRNRDPLIRQQSIPDVVDTTYWVGSLGDGALPPDIEDLLNPYRNLVA